MKLTDKFKTDFCTTVNKMIAGYASDDALLEGAEALLNLVPDLHAIFPGDDCESDLEHIYAWEKKWSKKWEWERKAEQKTQKIFSDFD